MSCAQPSQCLISRSNPHPHLLSPMASAPDETKKLNVVENTKNDGETLGLIGELKGESSPDLKRCQTFDGNALKLPKMLPVLSRVISKPVTKKEKGDVKKKRAKRYVDLLAEARFVPFEEDEKGNISISGRK